MKPAQFPTHPHMCMRKEIMTIGAVKELQVQQFFELNVFYNNLMIDIVKEDQVSISLILSTRNALRFGKVKKS